MSWMFGHEQDAVAEVVTHDGHAADQCFGQDIVGHPFAFQQDVHAFFDFLRMILWHERDSLRHGMQIQRRNRGRVWDSGAAMGLPVLSQVVFVLILFYSLGMKDDVLRNRAKGRGASSNQQGRFEAHARVAVDDGWARDEDLPVLRTQVSQENARSLVTYNRSPDLPFDRSINPYRGCEHGCIYCFARPSHAYLGLSPGLDFETRLVARPNAAQVLRRELGAKSYKVAPIAIGTNTDPYQPLEKTHEITRACLEVLRDARHPVAIVTKGSLIERDIDILGDMARRGLVRVGISITTLDARLSRLMEPRAPAPQRRLQMVRRMQARAMPAGSCCACRARCRP